MTDDTTTASAAATAGVAPVPAGYTSLTPFVCVDGAAEAIEFYTAVLGATLVSRMDAPDGRVAHAELQFASGRLQLSDPMPDAGLVAPDGSDAVSRSIVLYCEDADAVMAAAESHGATVREPVSTFLTGDRFGSILDPFGQRWAIMTRVEDVSAEEAERRIAAWLESGA